MFRILREICQPTYVDPRANQEPRTQRMAFADRVRAPTPFKTIRESNVKNARLAWVAGTNAAFYLEFIGYPSHIRVTATPNAEAEEGAPPVEATVAVTANRAAPIAISGLAPNTDYVFTWTTIYPGGIGYGVLPTTVRGANPDREYNSVVRRRVSTHGPPRNVEPQPSVRAVRFAAARTNPREQVWYRLVLVDAEDPETQFQTDDFTPTTMVTAPGNHVYHGTLTALYSTGDEYSAPEFEYAL